MSIYALKIDVPYRHVDRTLATASWWDAYLIQPGVYPIVWKARGMNFSMFEVPGDTLADAKAYAKQHYSWTWPDYGEATVQAVLVESYRESRLLSAVTSKTEQHDRQTTLTWRPYAYDVKPGVPAYGGQVIEVHGGVIDRFLTAAS